MSLLLLVVFLIVAGVTWLLGLWNSIITLIYTLIAGMIALNYFEPLANLLSETIPAMADAADVAALWISFVVSLGILWGVTMLVRSKGVQFIKPVDLIGRTVFALWVAWLFVGFTALSLHTAPLAASPLGAWETPSTGTFFGLYPEIQWLGLVQSRSQGALSRTKHSSAPVHPTDQDLNAEVFDPQGEFILKYYQRRQTLGG